ncbi:YggS family pyridoxal phosphate-dependent enzyme [Kangiella sp. TOML190]|uniref:YggS family pyridoxal phosphate-dependent enzyme n=1 Tax=Kangiella sp. TOML190 TaxID=2931351 RepID=UPI0020414B0F|nr:YggS family pyridoxal phosphate-dependent enzyme [Kangiella sp. TOML190]
MTRIASTLEDLQLEIAKSTEKSQNFRQKVRLVAVSKRQSVEKMVRLAQQGQRDFAENQLQEALEKIPQLIDFKIKWHFIGAIQSRKCKAIAENFDWVQSVDRAKLIPKLAQARLGLKPLNVCIQLNLFNESQKAGAGPEEVFELAELIENEQNLALRGLMVLPPRQSEFTAQKRQFEEVYDFYRQLAEKYPNIDTISMGMSGDFAAAIAAGSTMVRVGTRLFGDRN